MKTTFIQLLRLSIFAVAVRVHSQSVLVPVAEGWANNSVNTTVFRKNSLVTFRNNQYIAFYNAEKYLVLGKRPLGSASWELKQTSYRGNASDAHNSISIMVDGAGFLHVAWDHHNNELRYCRSQQPGSLELTEKLAMTHLSELSVSYPEFFKLPKGDLLFFYRNGGSGKGNLIINRYNIATQRWTQLHQNLIDGEGKRSAYWQACTDAKGTIYLSWVWRESPDVASNHDLCFAKSRDGGRTWQKSTGEKYTLPITAASAEIISPIAQQSELINQTSMFTDASGNPYIATYWREAPDSVPQYHLVFRRKKAWHTQSLGFRQTPFTLSGGGTKRIPVSRPQIIAWKNGRQQAAALVFRDAERGDKVSIAVCENLQKPQWTISDLTSVTVGSWEPTYDTELWKEKQQLHLFVQRVEQIDGEGITDVAPQLIYVLEWQPDKWPAK